METITKTFNIYEFKELSDSVKEKIIHNYRNDDIFDACFALQDYTSVLNLLGFSNVEISYNGFYSQGDGGSFTTDYAHSENIVDKIIEHVPKDYDLHVIAAKINAVQKAFNNELLASISRTHSRYSHEYSVNADIYCKNDIQNNADSEILDYEFKNLMRWIYKQLEKDYEAWHNAENIIEEIGVNEYKFLENGEIYN